jgi:hypothetical protein
MEGSEFITLGTIVGCTLPKLNYQKSKNVYFFRYLYSQQIVISVFQVLLKA